MTQIRVQFRGRYVKGYVNYLKSDEPEGVLAGSSKYSPKLLLALMIISLTYLSLAHYQKQQDIYAFFISEQSRALQDQLVSSSRVLTVREVQAALDEQTTLVSYYIYNEESMSAFVITSSSFTAITLPVDRSLETIAFFNHFLISGGPHSDGLRQVYKWLIAPLSPYLKTQALIIVPHNELRYLPFAALTDGEQYLVDKYVLSTLPSASALLLPFTPKRIKLSANRVLVLGNPITSEPLPSLNFAEEEARAIADLYQSQVLVGAAATERAVWSH